MLPEEALSPNTFIASEMSSLTSGNVEYPRGSCKLQTFAPRLSVVHVISLHTAALFCLYPTTLFCV